MPRIVRRRSTFSQAIEGLTSGLQLGMRFRANQAEIAQAAEKHRLAKEAAERDKAADELATKRNEQLIAISEEQRGYERERQEGLRRARSVEEADAAALRKGQEQLFRIHGTPGLSDEELQGAVSELRGIAAQEMSPEARAQLLQQAGDAMKVAAINRSSRDVADTLTRLSTATVSEDGTETPGLLSPEQAEIIAAGVKEYRDTRGASGISPDKARETLFKAQSEHAGKAVQAKAWQRSAVKMQTMLDALDQGGFDLPDENYREAQFVLELANLSPPKTAEQQAETMKMFRTALFGGSQRQRGKSSLPTMTQGEALVLRDLDPIKALGGGAPEPRASFPAAPRASESTPQAALAPATKTEAKPSKDPQSAFEAAVQARAGGASEAEVRKILEAAGVDPDKPMPAAKKPRRQAEHVGPNV